MTTKNLKHFCGNRSQAWLTLGLMSATLTAAVSSRAEGFRNSTIGTFGLGRSGGRIAQVDDATAVQQNPANLVDLAALEMQFTPSVIYIKSDFHSASTGQTASTKDPWKLLPNFFVAAPLANQQFAVGLGVTVPYGLGNEWDRNSAAFAQPTGSLTYFAPYYSQLTTLNFNPSAAVKLTDTLSLGVGLDVMWSDLEFKQLLYAPGLPNLEAFCQGDGVGVGGNAGITWQVTPRQRLALTYRSTMTVKYSGTTEFRNFAGTPSTSFDSQITFPNIIAAGYGIKLTDTVRVEADVEWLQFSQFRNLPAKIGPNYLIGEQSQNTAENWKNTFTFGFGGDWRFAEQWTLRAGYQYFESPVPNNTFTPTIPDANQNVFTLGIGWKGRHQSVEAAYGLDFYDTRNITSNVNNPAYNGKYSFNVHLFSLAYRYAF